MVMNRCPRCNQRYVCDNHNTDIIHTCNSDSYTLNNEDIVRVDVPNPELQGAETKIPGMNINEKNSWGNNKSTRKERQHYEFIDLKKV
jgi:hypothetical protein